MLLFTLKIFGICISLLAWFTLSLACFSLIWRYWKNNQERVKLLLPVLAVIWSLITYHTWYEGFFLLGEKSFFPSLNSWILTLIIPLLYLYYRLLITAELPNRLQWLVNLSPSGILLCVYMTMAYLSHFPDKTLGSWSEFLSSFSTWGVLFRMGCCVMSVFQSVFYLSSLRKADREDAHAPFLQRKIMRVLCLAGVVVLNIMFSLSVYNLLDNLLITACSGIIFFRSPCFKTIKSKLKLYLCPANKSKYGRMDEAEYKEDRGTAKSADDFDKFSDEIKYRIHQIVDSRDFLFDPKSTIVILANKVSVNITYLSQYFNKELKVSFREYMKIERLKIAEEFLEGTDMQIADIGISIGFKNISTFSQAFHEHYGMTPMQWRNEKKKTRNE